MRLVLGKPKEARMQNNHPQAGKGSGCCVQRIVRCLHIDVSQSRLWLPCGSSLMLTNPKIIWDGPNKAICELRASNGGEQIFYANIVISVPQQRVAWQIKKCFVWLQAKCGNALNHLRWLRLSNQPEKHKVSCFHKCMAIFSKCAGLTPNEKS
jgi:hypothetical protein